MTKGVLYQKNRTFLSLLVHVSDLQWDLYYAHNTQVIFSAGEAIDRSGRKPLPVEEYVTHWLSYQSADTRSVLGESLTITTQLRLCFIQKMHSFLNTGGEGSQIHNLFIEGVDV